MHLGTEFAWWAEHRRYLGVHTSLKTWMGVVERDCGSADNNIC